MKEFRVEDVAGWLLLRVRKEGHVSMEQRCGLEQRIGTQISGLCNILLSVRAACERRPLLRHCLVTLQSLV